MLDLDNISKSFKDKQVLKNISLHLKNGEVYGLIGKNGAGKTTLMNIIANVLTSDSGTIKIDDKIILSQNDLAGQLGYIIDIPASYEYLSPREYLEFLLSPQKLSTYEINTKIQKVLELVNLTENIDKRIKGFSRGMKQRLGIASGLILEPDIIIMDEPSSALDPEGRLEVLNIITNLKNQGKTILLSTHILNDVERVCDRIGIIVNGEIVVEGKTKDIMKNYSNDSIVIEFDIDKRDEIKSALKKLDCIKNITDTDFGLNLEYDGDKNKVFIEIIKNVDSITSIGLSKMTIEDIFILENKKGGKK